MMSIVIVSTVYGDMSNTLYIFTQMITHVTNFSQICEVIYMLLDSMGESFRIRKSVVCESHIGLIIYLCIVFSLFTTVWNECKHCVLGYITF